MIEEVRREPAMCCVSSTINTAWERDDVSFICVDATARLSDPARMNISICTADSGWYAVSPSTKYSATAQHHIG
eukprot:COSAG01_NODE_32_length_35644_cov_22.273738_3_plen_74_part_00